MLNTVNLLGTIGDRGVVTRPNDHDTMHATFTLAVPEDNGFSLWVPCEAYGKALEAVESPKPGDLVLIEGKLMMASWTDKSGKKQRRLTVLAWTCKCVSYPLTIMGSDVQ